MVHVDSMIQVCKTIWNISWSWIYTSYNKSAAVDQVDVQCRSTFSRRRSLHRSIRVWWTAWRRCTCAIFIGFFRFTGFFLTGKPMDPPIFECEKTCRFSLQPIHWWMWSTGNCVWKAGFLWRLTEGPCFVGAVRKWQKMISRIWLGDPGGFRSSSDFNWN